MDGQPPPLRVKTWSLLMTALGDREAVAARPLSGGYLRDLMGEMGVKPEAARVALHRLRKDGWVEAARRGRESDYYLSAKGLAETRAVRARVYGREVPGLEDWSLWMTEGALPEVTGAHVVLGPSLVALPAGQHVPDAAALRVDTVPDWLRARCLPGELWGVVDHLLAVDAPQTDAERMLILHHWRRLALRDGFWLARALEPTGAAARCRNRALTAIGA